MKSTFLSFFEENRPLLKFNFNGGMFYAFLQGFPGLGSRATLAYFFQTTPSPTVFAQSKWSMALFQPWAKYKKLPKPDFEIFDQDV
jgi:hypothetical protein